MRSKLITFSIFFILSVMILTAIAGPAVAPDNDKPEKLVIKGTLFNPDTSSFEIEFSTNFGTATAGERAGFQIKTTMEISEPVGNSYVIGPEYIPIWVSNADYLPGERVPLVPQEISWDRNGGSVSGTVTVHITSELVKNGRSVAGAYTEYRESGIVIMGSSGPIGP